MLHAIAAMSAASAPATPAIGAAEAVAAPAAHASSQAERRQLTVMFIDLVGSTALSACLDPEDMRDVLRAYQDAVAGEVRAGTGMSPSSWAMACSPTSAGPGRTRTTPSARSRQAWRRWRVGRLTLTAGEPLAARVGIATGLVVVGDLVGEGAAREEAVVGETPNLAARLQGVASPGAVVVGECTRRLLGGLFELEDLGPQALKGIAEPVRSFPVVGQSLSVEGRFEAHQTGDTLPLVGRQQELALLLERWHLARTGKGQVVLLTGEPGIGKSRLVLALRERLGNERRARLRYQCSSHRMDTPLWPVVEQLERAASFARGDPPEIKLGKIEALLGRALPDPATAMPALAELLSLPANRRDPTPFLTPEQKKAHAFQVLLAQLEGLAAQGPVLMVLEDAHWLDPTTLELFDLVVGRIEQLNVLLIITCRPGFDPPWTGRAHVASLSLVRLERHQAAEVVERVTGGRMLPPEVLRQILEKTDGVPLFVEELTKAVLESGVLRGVGDHYELTGPLPPLAIPSTLQDSLTARLDRSAPLREVAQIGAAIGREFSYELLAAVAARPEDELHNALAQLMSAGLVLARGQPPEAVYTFKHALVQDAAYATLIRIRRAQIHGQIASSMAERHPDLVRRQPEVLARHLTKAGLTSALAVRCPLRDAAELAPATGSISDDPTGSRPPSRGGVLPSVLSADRHRRLPGWRRRTVRRRRRQGRQRPATR